MQALLQSSSEFLHEATGGLVFIKQVIVELPKTWPQRMTARSEPKWLFSKSDVRVEALKSGHKEGSFSTNLRRRCGQRGDFIRVSADVLAGLNTTKKALNDATYAFLNEWVRFRYGVFYEYGRLGHKKYPLSYCPCCNKVNHFCNWAQGSHRHNNLAPNMHNDICNGESTWDVIRRNKDFISLPPPDLSKPIVVEFIEIQQKPGKSMRTVLVLDVSRSMKEHRRLETLKEALDGFLQRSLDNMEQLAIVTFSTTATVQHPMMAVNHRTVKGFREALNKLTPDRRTCIGCGLQCALEVLNTSSESPEGASIVLLTDGVENEQPYIHDIWPQLLAANVEVVTMTMGDKAEEILEKLATDTKGQSYFFPDRLENLSRAYIEANSSAHELTHHRLGLITTSETAKGNATEPLVPGQGTTLPNLYELAPQIAAFKEGAERSHRKATNELRNLANATRLAISQSADGECFPNDGYNPTLDIRSAFKKHLTWPERSEEPMYIMYITKGFNGTVQETFILDEGLGNNTVVSIIRESAGNYSLMAWLVDPTGKRCQNCGESESGKEKSLTIPSPATPGTWTLQVECSRKGRVVITMAVTSQFRDDNNRPIATKCEAEDETITDPEDAVIYAAVGKGGHIVLDATVTAVVLNTEGRSCSARLRDNGIDPDFLANDGWYTGYFTQFTGKGRYAVRAYVYGDNKTSHAYRTPGFPPGISISKAGVALPPNGPTLHAPGNYTFVDTLLGKKTPTVPFERVAYCGYLKVSRDMRQTDVPPGIIGDLDLFDGYVKSDRTAVIILTWTWPGAHMTYGKAAAVEIRGSTNGTNLQRDFDSQVLLSNVVEGNLDPLPAGSKHNVSIALPHEWETSTPGDRDFTLEGYLAARVINADGLKGKLTRSRRLSFLVVNFTAESLTTGASITTRAVRQTKPGPAKTTRVPEKPYTKTIQATTSTPPTKGEPARGPLETTTPEAGHGRKNDHTSVIIWILLALVAGVVVSAITIILLLRAQCSPIAESQATATSTATMTTM
ncbi:calcium-activated chloride channel regulator 1-like [Dermacentor variabilis]|uniref:calcium-activated chloride channel regulator 1-like n=1 Tax=Dermacentor variabilis TaxID=34621 RepID=UPI003F5AFE65